MCKVSYKIFEFKSNKKNLKMKLTLMLFLVGLLDGVYSYKIEELKSTNGITNERQGLYSSSGDSYNNFPKIIPNTNCERPNAIRCEDFSKSIKALSENVFSKRDWRTAITMDSIARLQNSHFGPPPTSNPEIEVGKHVTLSPKQCKEKMVKEYIKCRYSNRN